MRLVRIPQPLRVAACGINKPALPLIWRHRPGLPQLRVEAPNAVVIGLRHASTKSQGVYRVKSKKTNMKKMGCKKTGDQYVIPGNIIYKQRGTIWHPGDNTLMGRDHTIHAAATGYVKYYRDPAKHPNRQYIGVVFNRDDKLPYPIHAERKRKLNMVAVPITAGQRKPDLSASGIPRFVIRTTAPSPLPDGPETKTAAMARQMRDKPRVLHLQKNYGYLESNTAIGRLMPRYKFGAPVRGKRYFPLQQQKKELAAAR